MKHSHKAKPSSTDQQDRSPARVKDQQTPKHASDREDMPGADGERSARADEDTYD
jgi:hypothetical protein